MKTMTLLAYLVAVISPLLFFLGLFLMFIMAQTVGIPPYHSHWVQAGHQDMDNRVFNTSLALLITSPFLFMVALRALLARNRAARDPLPQARGTDKNEEGVWPPPPSTRA